LLAVRNRVNRRPRALGSEGVFKTGQFGAACDKAASYEEVVMVMAYTEQQRAEAVAAIAAGTDITEVSKTSRIPLVTLVRWCVTEFRAAKPRKRGSGRKPIMDDAGLQILRELIQANGRLTLDELAAAFTEKTGKPASKPTVAKAMKALGFRKVKLQKAVSKAAPQSSPRYQAQHRREPTATTYPSTLTDREWQVLEPLLARDEKRGRPATNDKRLMINAIFYQLRTGNQWRYLPKDFPHWTAVWSAFRRMRNSGLLERLYDAVHEFWRQVAGRNKHPTAGIVDSQTVKTTEKGGFAATTPARRSRGASGIWSSTPRDFLAES
jgi:transposase